MEVIVSTPRNKPRKDPVIEEQGVFAEIAAEELKPVEKERIIKSSLQESTKPEVKIWSIKEISNRIAIWLHLKKPD